MRNSPLAYHTIKLMQLVSRLPDDEYERVVKALDSIDSELVNLHIAVFNLLVYRWAMFEEECRGAGRCWNEWLPDNVEPKIASTFFNDELRKVVVKGCVDLAPDWVVPSWVKWVASRLGIDLTPLRKLEWRDLVSRLVMYTVYVWALRGLSNGYLEHFQSENMEYAVVVASHVHWEIVETLAEPLDSALEPLKQRLSEPLKRLFDDAYEAAVRFALGSRRLGLSPKVERALRSVSSAVREVLEEYRRGSNVGLDWGLRGLS